ncbi:MAG: class I SAM-dependent methyltransferase [Methylococcales bacterium]|nr:class I SAM-dependent methyltransferase [Methylococcales bacterium]
MTLEIKWDNVYATADYTNTQAATVLENHRYLLPKKGLALDLACGLGANALLLAKLGLTVHAFDISTVALEKLNQQALLKNLTVHCQQQNIEQTTLAKNKFDVIVISRFLNRALSTSIIAALKPEGLLFYQTFTQSKLSNAPPNNPDYLLAENELLTLFSALKTIYYQEDALIGDPTKGNRNEALYIGQKIKTID